MLEKEVKATVPIQDERAQIELLRNLLSYKTEHQDILSQALKKAGNIVIPWLRAEALILLLQFLTQDQLHTWSEEALRDVLSISYEEMSRDAHVREDAFSNFKSVLARFEPAVC